MSRACRAMGGFTLFFLFWTASPTGFAHPEEPRGATVSRLAAHHKIVDPEAVKRTFSGGSDRGRFIVRLQGSPAPESMAAPGTQGRELRREWVRAAQDRVLGRFKKVRSGQILKRFSYVAAFAVEAGPSELQEILDAPEVVSIEEDAVVRVHTKQGIPLIGAAGLPPEFTGENLSIAVCDTGIDYRHPSLGGGGFPNAKVIGGRDTGNDDADPMDEHGHGTACAGIAAGSVSSAGDYIGGVAPGAKLYALKVSHAGGSAYHSNIIEAWEWCITHQNDRPDAPIMIISLSMGGGKFPGVCDASFPAMADAARAVASAGITIFASSGNDGFCDGLSAPACLSSVISVGAVFDANIGGGSDSAWIRAPAPRGRLPIRCATPGCSRSSARPARMW